MRTSAFSLCTNYSRRQPDVSALLLLLPYGIQPASPSLSPDQSHSSGQGSPFPRLNLPLLLLSPLAIQPSSLRPDHSREWPFTPLCHHRCCWHPALLLLFLLPLPEPTKHRTALHSALLLPLLLLLASPPPSPLLLQQLPTAALHSALPLPLLLASPPSSPLLTRTNERQLPPFTPPCRCRCCWRPRPPSSAQTTWPPRA